MTTARGSVLLMAGCLWLSSLAVFNAPEPADGITQVTIEVTIKGWRIAIARGWHVDIHGVIEDSAAIYTVTWLKSAKVLGHENTDSFHSRLTLEVTREQAKVLRYAQHQGRLYPTLCAFYGEDRSPRPTTRLRDLLRSDTK